ncbi:class I SAM-dependent methyltransferase [Actinophytocola sp.]|uniref:class I SAM-dependent methyltransferase n=1 Tax=Actinophytocola sp. TaxID=1872138 RepID=UPI003899E251
MTTQYIADAGVISGDLMDTDSDTGINPSAGSGINTGTGTGTVTAEAVAAEWRRRAGRPGLARVMRASQPAELNAGVTELTRRVLADLLDRAAAAEGRPLRSVLEAGCGIGRLTPVIAAHADRVVALDMTPPMLDAAQSACAGLSNVEFQAGRVEDACWHGEFDVAVSVWVLMHVLDEDRLRAACQALATSSRYVVLVEYDHAHVPVSRWSRLRTLVEYQALLAGAEVVTTRRIDYGGDRSTAALLRCPTRGDGQC